MFIFIVINLHTFRSAILIFVAIFTKFGFHVNEQEGANSTLCSKPLKLVNQFTNLVSKGYEHTPSKCMNCNRQVMVHMEI